MLIASCAHNSFENFPDAYNNQCLFNPGSQSTYFLYMCMALITIIIIIIIKQLVTQHMSVKNKLTNRS